MASAIPKEKPVELNSLKTNYFSKESGDGSESENGRQEEPRARTRAHRSDRISDINSINKNINKITKYNFFILLLSNINFFFWNYNK